MVQLNIRKLHGRQYLLYSITLVCLLCTLISFCLLFTCPEATVKLSESGSSEYVITSNTAPVLAQFGNRSNSLTLAESIKNKKTSVSSASLIHINSHIIDRWNNSWSFVLLGLDDVFHGNRKQACLLLDLPPPPFTI